MYGLLPLAVTQAAATSPERLAHLLKAQHYAALMLTTSLNAAGARSPQAVPSSSCDSKASAAAEAELQQLADITADAEHSPDADGQLAAAHAPSSTGPSAQPAAVAAAAAVEIAQGLAESDELPSQVLGWARWQPTPALLAALAAAAGKDSSNSDTGSTKHHTEGLVAVQTAGLDVAVAGAGAAQGLGSSALQVPELLLANLQLLAASLREAGQHIAALPVLQLARLVAQVALDSQVSA
jgi:hypothetical protein